MDFITLLHNVPLPRSLELRLSRYAKARGITPQEAASAAIQNYLHDAGEIEIRLAAAARALRDHQNQTRLNAPDHGRDLTA